MQMYDLPDDSGHFGKYGGVFVAETLIYALDELRHLQERIARKWLGQVISNIGSNHPLKS